MCAILFQELPILSTLDPAIYGPPESAITREILEKELHGTTVEQVITFREQNFDSLELSHSLRK